MPQPLKYQISVHVRSSDLGLQVSVGGPKNGSAAEHANLSPVSEAQARVPSSADTARLEQLAMEHDRDPLMVKVGWAHVDPETEAVSIDLWDPSEYEPVIPSGPINDPEAKFRERRRKQKEQRKRERRERERRRRRR